MLKGGASFTPRDLYFVRREGGATHGKMNREAIIRGDWKLLQNDPCLPLELHNLKTDPQELKSVYGTPKYAETQKELETELARLRKDLKVPDPDPAETVLPLPKMK